MYKALYQKTKKGATVIIRIKNLLNQQSQRLEISVVLLLCVQGVCCSQWYNLFIPLNLISLTLARALALSPLLNHQITGCSHSLALFIPRCRWRSAERPGSTGCALLCPDAAAVRTALLIHTKESKRAHSATRCETLNLHKPGTKCGSPVQQAVWSRQRGGGGGGTCVRARTHICTHPHALRRVLMHTSIRTQYKEQIETVCWRHRLQSGIV